MSDHVNVERFEWVARDTRSCLEFYFQHAYEGKPDSIAFVWDGDNKYKLTIPEWNEMKEYIEDMIEANAGVPDE